MEEKIEDLLKSSDNFIEYPKKYNKYFGEEGFIAYESIDYNMLKHAVDLHEEEQHQDAIEHIMKYYSPSSIEKNISSMRRMGEFKNRIKFINFALEDYKNKKYYAVIPILLMMIDGIVSDFANKGFHTEGNLDVWGSLLINNNGLSTIQNIFMKTQKKTTTEKILLPYRNGILHGRNLGYDNYETALKSWVMLFAIKDWVHSKITEEKRKEESKPKSDEEIIQIIKQIKSDKESLGKWKARKITNKYIFKLNSNKKISNNKPEVIAINYLNYWKSKNYGNMARLENSDKNKSISTYAGELNKKLAETLLLKYIILEITDEASSVTNIKVKVFINNYGTKNTEIINIRCVYMSNEDKTLVRDDINGRWIVKYNGL